VTVQPGQPFSEHPPYKVKSAPSAPSGASTKKEKEQQKEKSFQLIVSVSSAFELDAPLPVMEPSDAWLENATCQLPPDWITYRCAYTIVSHGWVENYSTTDVWIRPSGVAGRGGGELCCQKSSARRLLPAHISSSSELRVSVAASTSKRNAGHVRWNVDGASADRLVCWRLHEEVDSAQAGDKKRGGWRKIVLEAIVDTAPAPFTKMRVIRIYDSVTLENLCDRQLNCWAVGSKRAPPSVDNFNGRKQKRGATVGAAKVMKSIDSVEEALPVRSANRYLPSFRRWRGKQQGEDAENDQDEDIEDVTLHAGGFKRIDADTNMLRFVAASLANHVVKDHAGVAGTAGNIVSTMKGLAGQRVMRPQDVNIEEAANIFVRYRCAVERTGFKYENIRIRVQKLYQGVVTVVRFEPAEHRYVVWNDTLENCIIQQKGVPSEGEVLSPGQRLPFTWYVPGGQTELVAVTAQKEHSRCSEVQQHGAAGHLFKMHMDWLATLQHKSGEALEVVHILDPGLGVEVLHIMTKKGYQTWRKDQQRISKEAEGQALKRGGMQLSLQGLGIALVDTTPLQLLYAAMDNIEIHVSGAPARKAQVLSLEAPPVQTTGLGAENSLCSVPEEAEGDSFSKGEVEGKGAPEQSALEKMSKLMDQTLWQFLTSFEIPAIDVKMTMLNLQVDSHVPGSFYPCACRPFYTRSQLWRSLQHFAPRQVPRRHRSPVFSLEVKGCQVIPAGKRFVISSCEVTMDKLVVNLDEANIVGVCAYYCKLACYFNLPPFQPEHTAEGNEPPRDASFLPSGSLKSPRSQWRRSGSFQGLSMGREKSSAAVRSTAPRPFSADAADESQILKASSREWSLMVERDMLISELTTYISIRLRESMNPYLEDLQHDPKLAVLLGRLMVLFAAAAFQPAMVMVISSPLEKMQTSMTLPEMARLMKEHYVVPLLRTLQLTLFASMDWLGNPMHLVKGMLGGFRELVLLPYQQGLYGVPLGVRVCFCSVFGSFFDCLGRLLNSLFKGMDRMLFILYTCLGVKSVNRSVAFFGLAKNPVDVAEGVQRGGQLVMIQTRVSLLNVTEALRWFYARSKQHKFLFLVYFFLLVIVLSFTLVVGLVLVVLLFLVNVLQGLASSLYRGSAEYVSDIAPLQFFALELPVYVRPMRHVKDVAPRDVTYMGSVMSQFAYLPALAQAQIREEDYMPEWLRNVLALRPRKARRALAAEESGKDEIVQWVVWCGVAPPEGRATQHSRRAKRSVQTSSRASQSTMVSRSQGLGRLRLPEKALADGEAQMLVATDEHLHLLKVADWGNTSNTEKGAGRPGRVKASYTWVWKVKRSLIRHIFLKPWQRSEDSLDEDWILSVHDGPAGAGGVWKSVGFSDKDQAWRAFQLLHLTPAAPRSSAVSNQSQRSQMHGVRSDSTSGFARVSSHLRGLDAWSHSQNMASFTSSSQSLGGLRN